MKTQSDTHRRVYAEFHPEKAFSQRVLRSSEIAPHPDADRGAGLLQETLIRKIMKHHHFGFFLSLMLAVVAGAQEVPLLTYQWRGGLSPYKQIGATIMPTGETTVSWQKHEPPVLRYQTTLSAEEIESLRALIRATDFFVRKEEVTNPGPTDTGETEFAIQSDGQSRTLKYRYLPALGPLEGMIGKLTAQAFAAQAIESDGDIGVAACAVTPTRSGGKALQPDALKTPLTIYASGRHTRQKVQTALEALSFLTSPEEYRGFISKGLGDPLQKDMFLGIIGSHPFYGNIPATHLKALCPIYLSYVGEAASREAELTQTEKEALSAFTYLLGVTRYQPAIPVLLKWFEAYDRPGAPAPLIPLAKMGEAGVVALAPYLDSPKDNYRINAIDLLKIASRSGPHAGFALPLTESEYERMIPTFTEKVIPRLKEIVEKDTSPLARKWAGEALAEIQERVEKERSAASP